MVLRRLEEKSNLLLSDPVRPHIPMDKRLEDDGEVWIYDRDGEPAAITCMRWTSRVPVDEKELFQSTGDIAVLYTIWALQKGGAGELIARLKETLPQRTDRICRQIVTLSPPTTMARDFHLRHGAILWRTNPESVNYQHWELVQDECNT